MNSENAKALAKQHAPTLVIAAVTVAAIKMTTSSPQVPPAIPSAEQLLAHRVASGDLALPSQPGPAQTSHDGIETRLVSCGGRGARVDGDGEHSTDDIGTVTLGADPKGTCTLIFASGRSHRCAVNGGHVAKELSTEIVVDQIDGPTFAYRCEP